jgi:hypothetical protein
LYIKAISIEDIAGQYVKLLNIKYNHEQGKVELDFTLDFIGNMI